MGVTVNNPASNGLPSGPQLVPGGQSAVPVMLTQNSQVQSSGLMVPGPITSGVIVTLSATSGAGVLMTLNTALFAGTSTDNGKQVTVYDAANSVWRSALITAFSTTLIATVTLLGTWSSASIAATTVALGNPLPANYTGVWSYLPAGAVSGGAVGFYWCTATSTATASGILQVTTAYQAAIGTPAIPSVFSNAVGSGANFTQTTSIVGLGSISVAGSSMGANGGIRAHSKHRSSATAGGKQYVHYFGGSAVNSFSCTTQNHLGLDTKIWNCGVQNNFVYEGGMSATFSAQMTLGGYQSVDTTQSQPFNIAAILSAATDFCILEGYTIEVLPA